MKRTVVSIPVHECLPCIVEQIDSIKKFVKSSTAVVLHVSGDSSDEIYNSCVGLSQNTMKEYLYVNPTRFKSHKSDEAGSVTGLSSIFASNFEYIDNLVEFDTYALVTSNELFVNDSLDDLVENFSACFPYRKIEECTRKDAELYGPTIKHFLDFKYHEIGVAEGTFYPREEFRKAAHMILNDYPEIAPLVKGLIPCQEYVIPTTIYNLYPELYEKTVFGNFTDHDGLSPYPSNEVILNIFNKKVPYKASVKRVPRVYDHPTRVFIRNLIKD